MHRTNRRTALFCLAIAIAACDSPTRTETVGELSADAAETGVVAPGAAPIEYELVLPPSRFRLLLQARSGSAADTLVAQVIDAAGTERARATSVGTDTERVATGWIPQGLEGWRVRVRGLSANDGGAYTVAIFPEDPAPENVPAALQAGQAVTGESIDFGGETDAFTLSGTAGEEWIVFAQALAGRVTVHLVDTNGSTVLAQVQAHAPTAELEERSTGRIVLPRTGTYTVRAAGADADDRGAYRIRADRVQRAPEADPPALQLGTAVEAEIGSVGDVDEFTFQGTAGQQVSVLAQIVSGMSGGIAVELVRGATVVARAEVPAPAAPLLELAIGRTPLPEDGAYTVRVLGPAAGSTAAASGRYRLTLYRPDNGTEGAAALALDGSPVTAALDAPGDVDDFTFSGTAGQMVVLRLAAAPANAPIEAALLNPAGLGGVAVAAEGDERYSERSTLQSTGTYTVRVFSGSALGMGAYTVEAYTIDPAPEHVPAAIAIGQTVTGERIDRPGDLDLFTFTGDATRELNLFLGWDAGESELAAFIHRPNGAPTGMFTFAGEPTLDGRSSGRFRLESAPYVVRVGARSNDPTGPYALRLFPIDPTPEGRAAAYTLGTTVQGEPLYPAGDIDEYTFELAAPTRLRIVWTGPDNLAYLYPEGGATAVWHSAQEIEGSPVRVVNLPAGRYRMRVLIPGPFNPFAPQTARITYSFSLTPEP